MLKISKGHLFHLEINKAEDFPPGIEYHVDECKASPGTDSDQEIPLFSNFQCAQDGFKTHNLDLFIDCVSMNTM